MGNMEEAPNHDLSPGPARDADSPAKPGTPDMTRLWTEFPAVSGDSGRFLEEDR